MTRSQNRVLRIVGGVCFIPRAIVSVINELERRWTKVAERSTRGRLFSVSTRNPASLPSRRAVACTQPALIGRESGLSGVLGANGFVCLAFDRWARPEPLVPTGVLGGYQRAASVSQLDAIELKVAESEQAAFE